MPDNLDTSYPFSSGEYRLLIGTSERIINLPSGLFEHDQLLIELFFDPGFSMRTGRDRVVCLPLGGAVRDSAAVENRLVFAHPVYPCGFCNPSRKRYDDRTKGNG